jgi:UDP-N-acetylglucosamine acyltransferase
MNKIHPTVIIEGDVKLGEGNEILPYTVLTGPLTIGDNNIIGPQTVIGSPGEDTKNPRHDASRNPIVIGSNNIIREHVAVQKPCYEDITRLGDHVFVMHGAHIPHDAILEDHVVVTPLAVVGGISKILKGANLGMGCTIHQYSVVGQYSIVATNAASVKNVKPFSRYIPGKPISVNAYAIKKYGFEAFSEEITQYVLHGQKPKSDPVLAVTEHYEKLHRDSKREQYE